MRRIIDVLINAISVKKIGGAYHYENGWNDFVSPKPIPTSFTPPAPKNSATTIQNQDSLGPGRIYLIISLP